MHIKRVRVVEDALDANNTIARANRQDFDRAGVAVMNFMSAPGAGKTSLFFERVLPLLQTRLRIAVLEGDVQGHLDADRLARLDLPVVQINTSAGFGGECHLDANMVRSAIPLLPLDGIDLLIVENVGNLVCPAEFRIGEDVRVMIALVTEGEDKPLKYPLMFRTCDLVLINKIDLLLHLDFDMQRLERALDAVHPGVERIMVSARTGAGLDAWAEWWCMRSNTPARICVNDWRRNRVYTHQRRRSMCKGTKEQGSRTGIGASLRGSCGLLLRASETFRR